MSVARQCELLGLARSSFYYQGASEGAENLALLRLLDEQYLKTPFYGSLRMTAWLRRQGWPVNHKRVARLMRLLGIEGLRPKRALSRPRRGACVYPYLLRGVAVTRPDQVWCADITYVRLAAGWLYLVAILDWFSRYVLAWALSNTLDGVFCEEALEQALCGRQPEIFNSDQGAQFTAEAFTQRLAGRGIRISMDGRGRVYDNIFIERLWRTVKYEEVYLKDYGTAGEAQAGLKGYFGFYNGERLHQALSYRTPAEVYRGCAKPCTAGA